MKTYKFIKEWDVDDENLCPGWKRNRELLNGAIKLFNLWQLDGCPGGDTKERINARVQYARQLIDKDYAGDGYFRDLDFIEEYLKEL